MNELESYALDVSDKTFRPLMEFDLFYYSLIKDHPAAANIFIKQMSEKWGLPTEDEHIELDIVKYAPV